MRRPESVREDLESIFRAGVARVNPMALTGAALRLRGNRLTVKTDAEAIEVDLDGYERVVVIGVGKASASMAAGLEAVLGDRITEGLVVTKYGHVEALSRVRLVEAGHPVPDRNGVEGAEAVAEMARRADAGTLVLNLISGGGSALLPAPYREETAGGAVALTLEDKQDTTRTLLGCGASIQEVNCIRKHLSALKGGRLAGLIHPARSVNLILSDVVGDRLDAIASGLTVPDDTTFEQARSIVAKYGIAGRLPPRVIELLERGVAGEIPETPKPGDRIFERVTNILLGSNATALAAAAERAEELGYTPVVLSSRIEGEAREVAKVLAAIALEQRSRGLLGRNPLCLLSGGETTVTLRGDGLGGRNQELALSFLAQLEEAGAEAEGIVFLSAATDGDDGPTDAAGAFASLAVAAAARAAHLSVPASLAKNDSYHFHEGAGSLLKTGPTNTNVCDLHLCLVP